MASFFKKMFGSGEAGESADYLEIETGREIKKGKIILKPFVLKTFEDVNKILEVLREGYAIVLIDIKPLKTKDITELKRAIAKLKKTVDALEGSVAGFGDNVIVAAPSFVEISRGGEMPVKAEKEMKD